MVNIIWAPTKNTEREAVRKFGNIWRLVPTRWNGPLGQTCLVASITGTDLRWIFPNQVKSIQPA